MIIEYKSRAHHNKKLHNLVGRLIKYQVLRARDHFGPLPEDVERGGLRWARREWAASEGACSHPEESSGTWGGLKGAERGRARGCANVYITGIFVVEKRMV